jgi:hypothetical protein
MILFAKIDNKERVKRKLDSLNPFNPCPIREIRVLIRLTVARISRIGHGFLRNNFF